MTPTTSPPREAEATRRVGPWRAMASGWRVFIPAVVIDAAVQGMSVLGDPVPSLSWGFWLLVGASLLSVVLMVWGVSSAAAAAVTGRPRSAFSNARRQWSTLVLSLLVAVIAVGAAVLQPLLPVLVLLLAAFVLPAVSAGGTVRSGFTAVAAAPVRYLIAVIGFVVLVVLSWVVALVLGLFVTGPVAAGVTWLWFGLALVVVLCVFSSLYRRSRD